MNYGENEMKETSVKPSGLALLPILVFLVLFIGTGVITNDFYAMPAVVGFLIALGVAFFQTKGKTFNEKITIVAKGVGDDNIITMCLIFLAAGAFSGAVSAAGGVDSTVNLGLSLLPPQIAVIGLFVIGCFISISMGTSMGTIAALAPIAAGISEKTDFSMAICIGAVVSGAMFGDNLSMISDTTIAAVKTQGCEMRDKFKRNFFIVLPAAIATVIVLFFITGGGDFEIAEGLSYNLLQVIPYILCRNQRVRGPDNGHGSVGACRALHGKSGPFGHLLIHRRRRDRNVRHHRHFHAGSLHKRSGKRKRRLCLHSGKDT